MDIFKNLFKRNNSYESRRLTSVHTDKLSNAVNVALELMLAKDCPCRFPRFRYLSSFYHRDFNIGAVFCADANYLVGRAVSNSQFLILTGERPEKSLGDYGIDDIYSCLKCQTKYRHIRMQYSINFEFEFLKIEKLNHTDDVGEDIILPFSIYQGLYGFDQKQVNKALQNFKLTSDQEFVAYLTQKK